MSELYGIVSLGGTVIGASLNQRGLKGETGATGATGNGIASISKTGSSGLIDTYTITYTNGNTATFTVTNGQDGHSPIITASKSGKTTSVFLDGTKIAEIDDGVGIDSIYKTGSSGLDPVVDEYTILYDDGNYTTFTVTNGKKGDKGDPQSPYTSTPNMDGVGSAGSSSNYSRGDHVHPSDTTKVDKVAGKGLSENDFTDSLKTKLDGIASGAEVNVQSDWNQSTNTADDYIKNKPDLSVYAPLASPSLTGTPTAPTATEGTNTTQIATTAFVKTADDAVKGMLKDALPTDTASGAIASFPDGSDLFDYLSCIINIDPLQDLHGYDKPWVGGAGKNKLPNTPMQHATRYGLDFTWQDDGTLKINGTPTSSVYNAFNENNSITLKAGNYAISKTGAPNVFFQVYKSGFSSLIVQSFENQSASFTLSEDTAVAIRLQINTGSTYSNTALQLQLEKGSSATSFAPYENICPISGHDEVEVGVVGKNLFDEANATIYRRYFQDLGNTHVWTSDSGSGSFAFPCKPNTTYTVSCDNPSIALFRVAYIDVDPDALASSDSPTLYGVVKKTASGSTTITTGADAKAVVVQVNNAIATARTANLQIELGSTATSYEPYNGQTYTTTLPSTTYGGTLDLVSGVLTVTHRIVDMGSLTYLLGGSYNNIWYAFASYIKAPASDSTPANIICTNYPTFAYTTLNNNDNMQTGVSFRQSDNTIRIKDLSNLTPAEFKEAMSGVQLCYELATPTTYQLTPQQIQTLVGQNNVWADCGDVSVTYKADIQKYIDNAVGTKEEDMVANNAITSGSLFSVNDQLYKATATIAVGETITVGVNCTETSIIEELNSLITLI